MYYYYYVLFKFMYYLTEIFILWLIWKKFVKKKVAIIQNLFASRLEFFNILNPDSFLKDD